MVYGRGCLSRATTPRARCGDVVTVLPNLTHIEMTLPCYGFGVGKEDTGPVALNGTQFTIKWLSY